MDSSCTSGYLVWACGEDPWYTLKEKDTGNYRAQKQFKRNHWVLLQGCKSDNKKDVDKEIQCPVLVTLFGLC